MELGFTSKIGCLIYPEKVLLKIPGHEHKQSTMRHRRNNYNFTKLYPQVSSIRQIHL